MKNSLKKLLDKFPYFLDRRGGSNFYKSEWVFNEWFKEAYNDLFMAYCGHKLSKPLLLWKTQEADYKYSMNFAVVLDDLKTVIIYKNGTEIYREEYSETDEVDSFYYLHEDTSNDLISKDSYLLYAESYNEYTLVKGFPENDPTDYINVSSSVDDDLNTQLRIVTTAPDTTHVTVKKNNTELVLEQYENIDKTLDIGVPNLYDVYHIEINPNNDLIYSEKRWSKTDSYNHDSSLDELGVSYSMPRKKYTYTHKKWQDTYWAETEPLWNNRYTEDDYHYMNRMITYTSAYHTTPLPVLELWKLFGVEATMENRNDLLCKMYEESLHDPDWKPSDDFSHKNLQYVESDDEDDIRLLYAFVDNSTPFTGTSVNFDLTLYNRYFDVVDLTGVVEVYERTGEDDYVLVDTLTDAPKNLWVYDTLNKEGGVHIFLFKYYDDEVDKEQGIVCTESDEVFIQIIGCDDAHIFVSTDGDDGNDGSKDYPVKTVERAVNLVEDSKNIIFLGMGEFPLSSTVSVYKSCTITHCYRGSSNIVSPRNEVFNISPNTILNLINVDSWYGDCYYSAESDVHKNSSKTGLAHDVIINPDNTRVPVVVTVSTLKTKPTSSFLFKGSVKTMDGDLVSDKEVNFYMGNRDYTSVTTENGDFTVDMGEMTELGEYPVLVDSPTDDVYKYCYKSVTVIVKKYDTVLTAFTDKSSLYVGESFTLSGKLVDEDNEPVTGANILNGSSILATTDDDGLWVFTKTGDSAGTLTYNLSADVDTTCYNLPTGKSLSVTVKKRDTTLTASVSKNSVYVDDTVTYSGKLVDNDGNGLSGVDILNGSSVVCKTGSDGTWSYNKQLTSSGTVNNVFSASVDTVAYNSPSAKTVNVTVNKYTTVLSVTSDASTYKIGKTATVTAVLKTNTGTVLGSKTITLDGVTKTTDSSGKVSATYSCASTGSYKKSASYSGDYKYNSCTGSVTYVVTDKTPTVLSVSVNSATVYVGDSTTVTCTLKDSSGNLISNASISDGSTTATTNSSGVATFTYTNNSSGTFSKTYTFSEDSEYAGSTNKASWTVNKYSTTLTITKDKTEYYVGDTTTVKIKLTASDNKYLYDGSISDGSTTTTTDSTGVATFTYSNTSRGSVSKTYTYGGNYKYATGSASTNWTVEKKPTSISLSVDKTSADLKTNVTFTGTLKDSITGTGISNATVNLVQGANVLATVTTDSTGAFSKSMKLPSDGKYIISAKFDETSTYDKCESFSVTVTGTLVLTNLTLTTDKSTYYVGETTTVTATLKDNQGNALSGFTVSDGTSAKTTNSNGVAIFTYSNDYSGTNSANIEFEGTSTYNSCTGSKLWYVNKLSTSLTVTTDKSEYHIDDTATVTVTLKDSNGAVISGAIIYDGSATATTNSSGVATFTYAQTSISTTSKTYTYSGEIDYTSCEASISFDCVKWGTVLTATTSKSTYNLNEEITVTGTLKRSDGTAITGASIYNGGGIVAITDSNGAYSYSTTATPISFSGMQFTYNGDASMNSATAIVKFKVVGPYITISESSTGLIGETDDVLKINVTTTGIAENKIVHLMDSDTGTVYATATVGNDGTATLEYPCTGLGDKNVVAQYIKGTDITTSNILLVEDCIIYDPLTTDKGDWVLFNDATMTFSDNGMTLGGKSDGYSHVLKNKLVNTPYTYEVTVTQVGSVSIAGSSTLDSYTEAWNFTRWPNAWYELQCGGTTKRNTNTSMSTGDKFKAVITSSTAIGYLNTTEKCKITDKSISSHYIGFRIPYNCVFAVKDLKIKPYSEE